MVRQEKTCSFDITKVKRKSDARNEKVNRAITCLGREDHIIFNDTPINLVQKGGGWRLVGIIEAKVDMAGPTSKLRKSIQCDYDSTTRFL